MKLSSSSTDSSTVINQDELNEKEKEVSQLNPLLPNGKTYIPFWGQNPNVLFQGEYLYELFPVSHMSYNQKLNALTRSIILLTLISILLSGYYRSIVVGLITLGAVYVLQYHHEKNITSKRNTNEGFSNNVDDLLDSNQIEIDTDVFDTPKITNPFSNVLINDYDYNPNKKPAPPSFNKNVNEEILDSVKGMVKDINHDQPDIQDKLFKDLGEEMVFEQSLRPFHSTPNTSIPNDQKAFTDFCYGSMISCKEGNPFACARNMNRHTNY